jgi:hypothetical protein
MAGHGAGVVARWGEAEEAASDHGWVVVVVVGGCWCSVQLLMDKYLRIF